jgi:proline dehydrogenase
VGSKIVTDQSYHYSAQLALKNVALGRKLGIVFSTHNLESVLFFLQAMRKAKVPYTHPFIHFAQFRGMGDYLVSGFQATSLSPHKLVPFGAVGDAIPFLVRRIQENASVWGSTQLERQMMWAELKRRWHLSQWKGL